MLEELLQKILHELECIHWCIKHGQGVSEDVIDEIEHPDHED